MSRIYEIFGTDAHSMTVALMEAANAAELITSGASVALKSNLVASGSPDNGATTHAGVLSGCIEYLQKHGVTNLSVIESSWIGDNSGRAMEACGYDKVCEQYNVPFYDLKNRASSSTGISPSGRAGAGRSCPATASATAVRVQSPMRRAARPRPLRCSRCCGEVEKITDASAKAEWQKMRPMGRIKCGI